MSDIHEVFESIYQILVNDHEIDESEYSDEVMLEEDLGVDVGQLVASIESEFEITVPDQAIIITAEDLAHVVVKLLEGS